MPLSDNDRTEISSMITYYTGTFSDSSARFNYTVPVYLPVGKHAVRIDQLVVNTMQQADGTIINHVISSKTTRMFYIHVIARTSHVVNEVGASIALVQELFIFDSMVAFGSDMAVSIVIRWQPLSGIGGSTETKSFTSRGIHS